MPALAVPTWEHVMSLNTYLAETFGGHCLASNRPEVEPLGTSFPKCLQNPKIFHDKLLVFVSEAEEWSL